VVTNLTACGSSAGFALLVNGSGSIAARELRLTACNGTAGINVTCGRESDITDSVFAGNAFTAAAIAVVGEAALRLSNCAFWGNEEKRDLLFGPSASLFLSDSRLESDQPVGLAANLANEWAVSAPQIETIDSGVRPECLTRSVAAGIVFPVATLTPTPTAIAQETKPAAGQTPSFTPGLVIRRTPSMMIYEMIGFLFTIGIGWS
jgi:hypothetical protein